MLGEKGCGWRVIKVPPSLFWIKQDYFALQDYTVDVLYNMLILLVLKDIVSFMSNHNCLPSSYMFL